MHTFMIIAQVLGLVLAFLALMLILHTDVTNMQQMMVIFLICVIIQSAGYLLELMSTEPQSALWAVKVQYLGSCWVPLFFAKFCFYYCGLKAPKRLMRALAGIDALVFALAWTNNSHTLFYRAGHFITEADGYSHYTFDYGVGYYLFLLFSCGVPYIMAICVLLHASRTQPYRRKIMHYHTIIFLSAFPLLVLILYSCKVIRRYDPCPVTLTAILSLVAIFVWSRQNYDLSRVAADAVLSEMDDGVILLDNEQRISSYNPAAAGIFVTLNSYSVGSHIRELEGFPVEIFNTGGRYEFQLHGGYFEGHLKVICDKNNILRGYVFLIFDITKTKNYIEEITEMRERAEEANRAKSEFLANMSHEIRTPMNAIVGLSDLIIQESKGRKIYNYACDIKTSSQDLLAIINDILDISKVEVGKMELAEGAYYTRKMIGDVVGMMEWAASKRDLQLRCEFHEDVPRGLYGDDGRIRQILINILNNAVKFTKKGYVKLTVGGCYTGEDMWNLLLQVEDTGIGIRPEDMTKIFENFRQVDSRKNRNVEGTGLGLSISKKLAELMHGTIEVQSVYGEGSTFTIMIPQRVLDRQPVSEQDEYIQEPEERLRMFTAPDYKILVVDDNLINRKVALGMLKPYGFQLASAKSGPEAIEMVKKEKYDMIFMDHMMPDMDGVETTRIIREECGENGNTPIVIALTANAMAGVREMFLANGFQDFLAKPVDRVPMYRMLDKWIPDRRRSFEDEAETAGAKEAPVSSEDFSDIVPESVDGKKAAEYHTGSAQDYLELLELFYMDGLKKTKYLAGLLENGDMKNYRIEVHALKSASANLGAMELSARAREHEEAAAREDTAFIGEHYQELMSAYKKLLGEIKAVLEKKKKLTQEQDAGKPPIGSEELENGLREALELISHFKSKQCAAKAEWLLTHQLPEDIRLQLSDVQVKLKMYQDDDAEDMLRAMVEGLQSRNNIEGKR